MFVNRARSIAAEWNVMEKPPWPVKSQGVPLIAGFDEIFHPKQKRKKGKSMQCRRHSRSAPKEKKSDWKNKNMEESYV